MKQNSTTGKGRGYREAVFGSFIGAVLGVMATQLLTVLLVGFVGLAGLELPPVLLSNILLLLLPPLAAVVAYSVALHMAGYSRPRWGSLFLLLLSPLASWLLWEAQQQLGAAALWSLRVIPMVLLTSLAPVAHALAQTLGHYGWQNSAQESRSKSAPRRPI